MIYVKDVVVETDEPSYPHTPAVLRGTRLRATSLRIVKLNLYHIRIRRALDAGHMWLHLPLRNPDERDHDSRDRTQNFVDSIQDILYIVLKSGVRGRVPRLVFHHIVGGAVLPEHPPQVVHQFLWHFVRGEMPTTRVLRLKDHVAVGRSSPAEQNSSHHANREVWSRLAHLLGTRVSSFGK